MRIPPRLKNLKTLLQEEWAPATETECQLVDDLALQQWKLRRAESMEVAALARSIDDATGVPTLSGDAARTARYVASIRRAWMNALTRLRQLQAERREREAVQPPDSLVGDIADFLRDETNPISPMSPSPQPVAPPLTPPAPPDANPADPAPAEPQ